jgi:hypothetical protein
VTGLNKGGFDSLNIILWSVSSLNKRLCKDPFLRRGKESLEMAEREEFATRGKWVQFLCVFGLVKRPSQKPVSIRLFENETAHNLNLQSQ